MTENGVECKAFEYGQVQEMPAMPAEPCPADYATDADYTCLLYTSSNEEQIGKLFQSEIIEIYRRELAKMPSLTRNVFLASRLEDMTLSLIHIYRCNRRTARPKAIR